MQLGSQGELNSELKTKIDNILQKDKIVLFMKGSKDFPQCGFSDTVVKVLKFYGADFTTYDVLTNPDLRSGMKIYSQWATFPQLYINNEFVGGCDIVLEMYENGELESLIKI
ncbi:MAG: type glutaredoxin 3 [Cyanobacteriota bacterium]|jgi:monothiol glutaredoxin